MSLASLCRHSTRVALEVRTKVMHGGQRERCASSAAAFSAGREPSTYSPRSSTQSEQCSKRLIIDVPLVSGSMLRKCGRFGGCHDRSLSKEIAKLLPERKPCAV